MNTGREVQLASTPTGLPKPANFTITEVSVPAPTDGQVSVRNQFFVLEPGTRLAMQAAANGVPGFDVHGLRAQSIGEVIATNSPDFEVGDTVTHDMGWREYAVATASRFKHVDLHALPTPTAHLSGALTGYVGLTEIARMQPGETVYVSSAAGTIGGFAGQLARLLGASRVIGSAGHEEKVQYLQDELRFDAVFNYHNGSLIDQLRAAAPNGIDVYYDNVGGPHLEAVLEVMNPHGRVALCGAMSLQGSDEIPPGPGNLIQVIAKRLTLRGFTVNEHLNKAEEFNPRFAEWLRTDKIRYRETIINGIDNAPDAFVDLLNGRYAGRVLVRLD